jgi:rubrerythrin
MRTDPVKWQEYMGLDRLWVCINCGAELDGDCVGEKCPSCGADADQAPDDNEMRR